MDFFDDHDLPLSGGVGDPDFIGDESLKDFKNAMVSMPISLFETALRFIDSNIDHERFNYTVSKESNDAADHSVSVISKKTEELEWLFIFKEGTRHRIVLPWSICRLRIINTAGEVK